MQARATLAPKAKWLTGIILILYIATLLGPQMLLASNGLKDPSLSLIDLAIQAVFWLLLIPLVTRIPRGKFSIPEYLRFTKLTPRTLTSKSLFLGVLIGIGSVSSYGLLSNLVYGHTFDPGLILPPTSWRLLWANTGAVFEEIAIRGVILSLFLLIYSERKALGLSSLIFGAGHILTFFLGDSLLESAVRVVYACLLGLIFGSLVIKTNNLFPAILAHMIINSLSSAFSGGASGVDLPFLASTLLTFLVCLPLIRLFSQGERPLPAHQPG